MKVIDLHRTLQTAIILAVMAFPPGCDEIIQEETVPEVTTGAVQYITNTSATCTGNLISTGNSYWVNRGVCFSALISSPDKNNNSAWADAGSHTGPFNAYLEFLTPGITYYVRAYATNEAGTGYGDVISFTTTGSVTGDIVFNPDLTYETITDIDGNTYRTIKIADQSWMAENLRTTRYNDGSPIPHVNGVAGWINRGTEGYCWYNNDAERFGEIFGALYNWYCISTNKICPSGWHVPGDDEWAALIEYAGGDSIAGRKMKESTDAHWVQTEASITNSTGFTVLPGGNRWGVTTDPLSYFTDLGYSGNFWSSTEFSDPGFGIYGAYCRSFYHAWDGCTQSVFTRNEGLSVRCIKDQ